MLALMYADGRGVAADERKHVELARRAADLGEAIALNALGQYHLNGLCGLEQSFDLALKYFKLADARGDLEATCAIGLLMQQGECGFKGDADDDRAAVALYERLVAAGNLTATYCLGECYRHGRGVVRSTRRAVELYHKAAVCGSAMALCSLAELLCENVDDVPANNFELAFRLSKLCVEKQNRAFHFSSQLNIAPPPPRSLSRNCIL